jgi:hypothetical protein
MSSAIIAESEHPTSILEYGKDFLITWRVYAVWRDYDVTAHGSIQALCAEMPA